VSQILNFCLIVWCSAGLAVACGGEADARQPSRSWPSASPKNLNTQPENEARALPKLSHPRCSLGTSLDQCKLKRR
jgi:hypothetical protein